MTTRFIYFPVEDGTESEVNDDEKYGEEDQGHKGHKKYEKNEHGDVCDDDKKKVDYVNEDIRAFAENKTP